MYSLKKVLNNDLFLLLLLIVRLGLQPDVHVHRWHLALESRSVLGPTSAYTQTSYFSAGHYPHPKSLESNDVDEATILFSRLNFYNTLNADTNLIACVANSPDASGRELGSEGGERALANTPATLEDRDLSRCLDAVELSAEDMDLIEILWKQDIDLGVAKEAYDSRPCLEEKLKDIEIKKEDIYDHPPDTEPNKEPALVPDHFAGLNYTIDSETGEYLLDEISRLGDICPDHLESELLQENETHGALSQDCYMPFGEDDAFCDLSTVLPLSQLTNLTDSDYLSIIEDLEKELCVEQFGALNESAASSPQAAEMYPTMEDCWPDNSTSMLPLLALSSSHQTPMGHPIYPPLNTTNTRSSDNFMGMLQGASVEGPATEEFHANISSGPSSIGCAVVESMATLANDTDPLPTSSSVHSAYNSEFPEIIYSNHTVAVPHNELLLSDLLLDEELHFGAWAPATSQEKPSEDPMDTSSDSISLTSGHLPSASDYESDRCFSDIPYEGGNEHYFTLKHPDVSDSDSKLNLRKFDYAVPKACSSSNFLHHNHSYHLPFSAEDCPGRASAKCSAEEDASNKDEKRAKELKLPISISDIINLAIDEYNERLSKHELTETQLTLIRDIRRRGKNKVAAQNCRKRKMDQISSLQQDLNFLQRENLKLKSKQTRLLHEKLHFEDKYAQLYEYVLRSSDSKPPNPPSAAPQRGEFASEEDRRAKRKFKK